MQPASKLDTSLESDSPNLVALKMKALPRGNSVVEDEDCLRFYLKLTFVTTNQSVTTIGYFTKMLDPFLTVLD